MGAWNIKHCEDNSCRTTAARQLLMHSVQSGFQEWAVTNVENYPTLWKTLQLPKYRIILNNQHGSSPKAKGVYWTTAMKT